jgi:hypothetical protein
MLWKYGRISRQDVLALTAVIISLAIGLFTFLSRSLPIEVEVYQTSTTLLNLPENNKSKLVSESLYYDLKNNISAQAKTINQQLLKSGIDIKKETKEGFLKKTKDARFTYVPPLEIAKTFIGKDPSTIPIVFSLSFINKTPNPIVIDELYFIISNKTDRLIYKPMYYIDSKKLFTNNFKKTRDILSEPFHPFLLTENSDKELHLFCIKWNLKNENDSPNSKQLGTGEYDIELNYHTTTNKKYIEKLPSINLKEKDLLDIFNGNKISIGNESTFYKELLKD